MKIASVNVRGINQRPKRLALFQWAKEKQIDILCLQETFCTSTSIPILNSDWSGLGYLSPTKSPHSRGVAIFFNENLNIEILNSFKSIDGRRLLINFQFRDQSYCIVNAYAPNEINARIKFFKKLSTWTAQNTVNESRTFLCGDLNCTLEKKDRNNNHIDRTSLYLKNLMKNLNMSDAYRVLHKDAIKYTYSNKSCTTRSRIDYVMISNFLCGSLRKVEIKKPPKIPDHKAVIATFHLDTRKGPGFWKLNTELLKDPEYCQKIEQLIIEQAKKYDYLQDARKIWFLCKIHIKEYSIKHSITKSQKTKQEIQHLENQINDIENSLSAASENEKEHYKQVKSNLEKIHDEIYTQKVKGMQIRSRANMACQSEQNPTFFQKFRTKTPNKQYYSISERRKWPYST